MYPLAILLPKAKVPISFIDGPSPRHRGQGAIIPFSINSLFLLIHLIKTYKSYKRGQVMLCLSRQRVSKIFVQILFLDL